MNKYPLWKYLLIATVLIVSAVYALPNLYPQDPSLQISSDKGAELDDALKGRLELVLNQAKLPFKRIGPEGGLLMVRFADVETQLAAQKVVRNALDDRYIVALNLAPATPDWLGWFGADPMYLGLDLRGGVHFLMEVDMNAALTKAQDRYVNEFKELLREKKIGYLRVRRMDGGVLVAFRDEENREKALDILDEEYFGILGFEEASEGEQPVLRASITEKAERDLKKFALEQNITTLRKRVNEIGVAEPVIQQQGEERVVVELPGIQDTVAAKEILGATATLEFRLVNETADPFQAEASGRIPVGDRLYKERNGNPILLKRRVMLTGDYITNAAAGFDQDSATPSVNITLDSKGARLFSKATGENVQRLMAVVFIETKTESQMVDGKRVSRRVKREEVINVARIQDQLSKRFQITGLDSTHEAAKLALLLRAGALAAPMHIVEERTIGPSLGKDNIDRGFNSVMIGFVLVLVFMAIYYRIFGLVANLALALNLVLIVAVLSMMQATLTLPGIAGIVLTVGMAVDANVLIFERIREELRNGMSPQAAISAGYEKALSTIADANVTTLIAAVVLFGFGTGPIKGFAVTLMIGIASSMFTAIMGTRSVINLIYGGRRQVKSLAI